MKPFRCALTLLLAGLAAAAGGGPFTGTEQSSRLYTQPDPSAGGGLRLRLAAGGRPAGVFALLQTDANRCYPARAVNGEWVVQGLPVGKYDLVIVFDDRFYDGLQLTRATNSLTAADLASIADIVSNSVPFFDTKKIHRAEGVGGKGGTCAIVLQEVRTRTLTLQSAEERSDLQIRSLKLGFLEEVNVGWQLVNTREIMRIEVGGPMPKGVIPNRYVRQLGNIRVTDTVKDLGEIRLD